MKSFKQRRLEKELCKQEEKRKQANALSMLIAIVFALFGMVVFPSLGSFVFLMTAIAVLPFAPFRKLWGKIPIKGSWFKPTTLMAAFLVACCFSPTSEVEESDSQTAYTEIDEDILLDEETEDVAAVAVVSDKVEDDAASPSEDEKTTDPDQTETENEEKTEDAERAKADTELADQTQNTEIKPDVMVLDVEQFDISAVPPYSGKAYTTVRKRNPSPICKAR